jgi:ATP-dependent DNA helicase RecQ
MLRRLRAEGHASLATARALTRFLAGLSSPAISRARLTRHQHFGALAEVRLERILGLVQEDAKIDK